MPTAPAKSVLTDNENWVYWAPFWYKDGKHIIYTAVDHSNCSPGRITIFTG